MDKKELNKIYAFTLAQSIKNSGTPCDLLDCSLGFETEKKNDKRFNAILNGRRKRKR